MDEFRTNATSSNVRTLIIADTGIDGDQLAAEDWLSQVPNAQIIDLADAGIIRRNTAVTRINCEIEKSGQPTILIGIGLSCHVIAWWSYLASPQAGDPVIGAILQNVPDASEVVMTGFGSPPLSIWPFPSYYIANGDVRSPSSGYHRRLATMWGSQFVDRTVGTQSTGLWDRLSNTGTPTEKEPYRAAFLASAKQHTDLMMRYGI